MLTKKIGLTIKNYKIAMTAPLKFFEDDDLELIFKIGEFGATVVNEEDIDKEEYEPLYPESAILFVETPKNIDSIEAVKIDKDKIYFRLTNKYSHGGNVGVGRMQIVLLDGDSRKALPPFAFEIQPVIYQEPPIMYNGLACEDDVALCSEDMMLLDSTDPVYGIKISELAPADEVIGFIPIVQYGETKKIDVETIGNKIVNDITTMLDGYGYATEEYVGNEIDSNIIFDNDMTIVNTLGGIKAGDNLNGLTLKDILNKLLFPYVAPNVSASLTYTPSGSIFEYGKSVSIQNIIGNVVKKSENIINIKFLDGNEVLQEITVGLDATSYKFIFQTPVVITSNMPNDRFRFSVTDASNETYYANTSSVTFYYPYYIGVIGENDVLTNELITSLNKKVEGKGTKSNNYTTNNQRMVFAYPKSYGGLSKILDANSFDVTGTFTKNELVITGLDGTEQDYYVYVNNASTMTNFKMTFYY